MKKNTVAEDSPADSFTRSSRDARTRIGSDGQVIISRISNSDSDLNHPPTGLLAAFAPDANATDTEDGIGGAVVSNSATPMPPVTFAPDATPGPSTTDCTSNSD